MNSKIFFHFILWFLAFNQGLFQIFEIPTYSYKVGMPVILITLGVLTFYGKKIKIPFFAPILILLLACFISYFINDISEFNLIYFFLIVLSPLLYFVILLNENDSKVFSSIKKIIVFFCLIQIPISLLFYFLYGQAEGNAGTLTISEGSISTIFPSIVIAYLISSYLFKRNSTYVILIILMIIFSLIGEKRAIAVFVPMIFVVSYVFYSFKIRFFSPFKILTNFIFLTLFSMIIFYASIRLNPTLNKEGKIGGSFDISYFFDYANEYNKIGNKDDFSEMQRFEGLIYFTDFSLNRPTLNLLFGDGAGKLISSRYSANSDKNLMLEYYGVRYGGRMGFVWMIIQVGLIGTFIFLWIHFKILFKIYRSKINSELQITILSIGVIFIADIFFYSSVFIEYFFIQSMYLFIIALYNNELKNLHSANNKF